MCRTASTITSGNVVACKATVSSKANARGSLEIRPPNNTVLNSQELPERTSANLLLRRAACGNRYPRPLMNSPNGLNT